jgi:hypothetical protein
MWKPAQDERYQAHAKNEPALTILDHYFGFPQIVDKNEVSIMTQMSVNKFQRLVDLDSRWKGYISVAVYLSAPYDEDLAALTRLRNQHFGTVDSHVSFHLVLNNGSYTGEFPNNLLRNVAMDYAVTDYALMLDVDFIPSPDTHANIVKQLPNFDLKHSKKTGTDCSVL